MANKAKVDNKTTGVITLAGKSSVGVYGINESEIENSGSILITNTDNDSKSVGILADKVTATNKGTIKVDGGKSAGMLGLNGATIANDGVRVAPRIVEGIYSNNDKGELGDLIQQLQPTEMNKVNISDSDMSILHQGFYQVAQGTSGLTTGRAFSNGALVSISGKTGTAESYVADGQKATNTNAVAYAPSDNPQIAVAVVFPHNTNLSNGVGPLIARDIINLYQQYHPMN